MSNREKFDLHKFILSDKSQCMNTSRLISFAVLVALISCKGHIQNPENEVIKLRQTLIRAIETKDKTTLENLLADEFIHVHASGKVDDKNQRIQSFLSGEKTIDTADIEEMRLITHGDHTAVIVGKSWIEDKNKNKVTYRWVAIYGKIDENWKFLASQATKISE
jgi:hypothetical protein